MSGPTHPRLALGGLVDGRLPTWRRVLVERHLDRCTGCALEVARIRSVRRLLADAPVPDPSPDLDERLLALGRPVDEPVGPGRAVEPGRVTQRRREPVGVLVAGFLLVAAVGVGAVVTGAAGAPGAPGAAVRASLVDVLPRLWTWPVEPGGALGGSPTDNGDSP